MEAGTAPSRSFDRLRENSIGLPQVLFQSITHMAPGAAIAFSILFSVGFAGPALPLSVLLALIACTLVAVSIGQLARKVPSAGGLYAYVTEALGPIPGFFVGAIFLCFEPLVAPLLFLIFAWATTDVFRSDVGWDYSGQWWIWVLLAAGVVFFLTYRDVRLSTNAGVALGIFEIGVFLALAIWMILSNGIPGGIFDPTNAEAGTFNGVFKGMVFAILAFIGFEAAAPLGEEARRPRWTVPRAVIGSCVAIGIFYFICSIAWVAGTGFDNFTKDTLAQANPWRHLAEIFLGRRLGPHLPRDRQLRPGELQCRRECGKPRDLRDGSERARSACVRPHASRPQDAVRGDRRANGARNRCRAAHGLEVEPAKRLRDHLVRAHEPRNPRVHHDLHLGRRDVFPSVPGRVQSVAARRRSRARGARVLAAAVLPVPPVAGVSASLRQLGRDRPLRLLRLPHDLDGDEEA
jgi:hypothetical protein